jgi:secreted trypsin-like serine protease
MFRISATQLCTGRRSGKGSACYGDSGAPLLRMASADEQAPVVHTQVRDGAVCVWGGWGGSAVACPMMPADRCCVACNISMHFMGGGAGSIHNTGGCPLLQVGVVSYLPNPACEAAFPTLSTSIASTRSWIDEQLEARGL